MVENEGFSREKRGKVVVMLERRSIDIHRIYDRDNIIISVDYIHSLMTNLTDLALSGWLRSHLLAFESSAKSFIVFYKSLLKLSSPSISVFEK